MEDSQLSDQITWEAEAGDMRAKPRIPTIAGNRRPRIAQGGKIRFFINHMNGCEYFYFLFFSTIQANIRQIIAARQRKHIRVRLAPLTHQTAPPEPPGTLQLYPVKKPELTSCQPGGSVKWISTWHKVITCLQPSYRYWAICKQLITSNHYSATEISGKLITWVLPLFSVDSDQFPPIQVIAWLQ